MNSNHIRHTHILALVVSLGLASGSAAVYAGSITDTYTTGDTLTATTMGNIKSAVNDNDGRVTTNAGGISTNTTNIGNNTTAIGSNTTHRTGSGTDHSAVSANAAAISNLQTGSGSCAGNNASDIMFRVGSICVDKYTSSLWDGTGAGALATTAALEGCNGDLEGKVGCSTLFAQSRSAGTRANGTTMSWGLAVRACANSGKRLLSPAEWTMAWQSGNLSDVVAVATGLEWIDTVGIVGTTKMTVGTIGQSFDIGGGVFQLEHSTGAAYDDINGSWTGVHFRCAR